MAAMLAPLMVTNLRAKPGPLMTCSDASSSGAGVAASAGLTDYGVWTALSLPPVVPARQEVGIALVSMFAGCEAIRRALCLLGLFRSAM